MTVIETVRRLAFNVYVDAKRPERLPIDVFANESVVIDFTIRNRAGAILDLTGVTATYGLARPGYQPGHAIQYTAATGITITNGVVSVAFTVNGDGSTPPNAYDDQLALTKDGKTLIVSVGRFNVLQDME